MDSPRDVYRDGADALERADAVKKMEISTLTKSAVVYVDER